MSRLHSLSDLSSLFGGPDAKTSATKMGGSAEAGRPGDIDMEAIAQRETSLKALSHDYVTDHRVAGPTLQSRFLREGFVRLTAEQAGQILKECRYARQDRDQKLGGRNQIATLADIMSRGQWRAKDQLDFGLLAGMLILLNGHHRLAAQVASKQTIEWSIVIHPCNASEDIERLFYSFDTNVRIRSNQNILAAADAARRFGLTHTTVEALYRAGPILAANFDFSRTARDPLVSRIIDRRMDLMEDFRVEAQKFEAAVGKAPSMIKRRIRNQGPFAVALMAFRYQPERARQFWEGLAKDDGLRKGDPRKTYLTALQSPSGSATVYYTARQIAVAWNAFYEGRTISFVRVDTDGPFRILGTPVGR